MSMTNASGRYDERPESRGQISRDSKTFTSTIAFVAKHQKIIICGDDKRMKFQKIGKRSK